MELDIPEEACIEVATYDWSVAGATMISWSGMGDAVPPVDLESAIQKCKQEDSGDNRLFSIAFK